MCLFCTSIVGMTSASQLPAPHVPFDSDSFPIMIDNCCSKCITNCFADFIGTPSKVKAQINGIGGPILITHKRTVHLKFEDDAGRIHAFVIPGTLYAPKAPCQMFSPQHWSQTANDKNIKGTWCATYDDKVVLHWNHGNSATRSVPLDPGTNVAIFRSASGMKRAVYELPKCSAR
jgi:hypothetical protein